MTATGSTPRMNAGACGSLSGQILILITQFSVLSRFYAEENLRRASRNSQFLALLALALPKALRSRSVNSQLILTSYKK
jgi:hypothetical protein